MKMTKNEILTELYKDSYFNNLFYNLKQPKYSEDLKHSIFEYLCSISDCKIIKLYESNRLKAYVHQAIKNRNWMILNTNYKFLEENYDLVDNHQLFNLIGDVNFDIEDEHSNNYANFDLVAHVNQNNILNFAEKEIFLAYFIQQEGHWLIELNGGKRVTQNDLSRLLDVSIKTIFKILERIKKKIKKSIKKSIY